MTFDVKEERVFKRKLQKILQHIEAYIHYNQYNLGVLTVRELVEWKKEGDMHIVKAANNCPSDIESFVFYCIVTEFTSDEEE